MKRGWRLHDGGEMPCKPDLWVEVSMLDGETDAAPADHFEWPWIGGWAGDIIMWRTTGIEVFLMRIEAEERRIAESETPGD